MAHLPKSSIIPFIERLQAVLDVTICCPSSLDPNHEQYSLKERATSSDSGCSGHAALIAVSDRLEPIQSLEHTRD